MRLKLEMVSAQLKVLYAEQAQLKFEIAKKSG